MARGNAVYPLIHHHTPDRKSLEQIPIRRRFRKCKVVCPSTFCGSFEAGSARVDRGTSPRVRELRFFVVVARVVGSGFHRLGLIRGGGGGGKYRCHRKFFSLLPIPTRGRGS